MALSQFGGRPGSGTDSASSGKEIGEVFLVPQTYNSSDVVDAGETIVNADYPLLFPKITNGSITNDFVTRSWPLADGALTNGRFAALAVHQNAQWAVLWDGTVVSSTDTSTWTQRGQLGNPSDANYSFLWNQLCGSSGIALAQPLVTMYSLGTRLVVVNYNNRYAAGFYTDDLGVTWVPYTNDSTLNTVLASSIVTFGISGGPGYAILVDTANKKIYRSTTGIGDWTNVTGAMSIPASAVPPNMFTDSTISIFFMTNTNFRSTDGGLTWTSAAHTPTAVPSNFVRYLGNLFYSSWLTNTRTVYKSTDNGATFASTGTYSSSASAAGIMYVGQDGALGVAGANARSTDGTTWVVNAANIAAYSGGYFNQYALYTPTGFVQYQIGTGGSMARMTADYGVTYNVVKPLGVVALGIAVADTATNTSGVTVMPVFNTQGTQGRNVSPHSNGSGTFFGSNVAYVGNWTTGFSVVTLPATDVWAGITWNAAAGLFLLTGVASDAVFTSPDGVTWTTVPLGSIAQSAKNTTPRTIGAYTVFIPVSGTVALQFFVVRPDGTTFWTKTPYTKAFTGTYSEYILEFAGAAVSTQTSSTVAYLQDPRLLNLASSSTEVPYTVSGIAVGSASRSASHKNVLVTKPQTAGNVVTVITNALTTTTTSTATYNDTNGATAAPLAVLYINNVIYVFTSNRRVRSSTDNGVTWTTPVEITTIPADETLFYGQTYGDGVVVLFGNRGTYIYDATGTTASTTKTLNNSWTAPAGLKYVVKAK